MLVRWNPLEELNRFEQSLWGADPRVPAVPNIAVDIQETDEAFVLEADLPGVSAEEVNVGVEKNVLKISTERHEEKKEQTDKYRRIERRTGSVSRAFSLPDNVDGEAVSAELKDGVLTVTLPKREAPGTRSVKVKVA